MALSTIEPKEAPAQYPRRPKDGENVLQATKAEMLHEDQMQLESAVPAKNSERALQEHHLLEKVA